jgi:hypothetical protein
MLPQPKKTTAWNPSARRRNLTFKGVLSLLYVCAFVISIFHSMVTDPTGAVVANATVTITDSSGVAADLTRWLHETARRHSRI